MDAAEKKEEALRIQAEKEQAEKEKNKPTKVKVAKKVESDSEEEVKQQTAPAKRPATATAAAPVPGPTDVNYWSPDQQKQMEQGMKTVPASVPAKERWVKIGDLVDGKTPKECFERFKEIVSKLKAK